LGEHFDGHDVLCDIAPPATRDAVLGRIALVVAQSVDAVPEEGTLPRWLDGCRWGATVAASCRDECDDLFASECPCATASKCASLVRDDDVVNGAVGAASWVRGRSTAPAPATAGISAAEVVLSDGGCLAAFALAVVVVIAHAVALVHARDREASEGVAHA